MKYVFFLLSIIILIACETTDNDELTNYYIIETTVQLKPGMTSEVLKLFQETNPPLVKNVKDWLKASFASSENDFVIVRAVWKNKESYFKFSRSEKFKKAMSQFEPFFARKPDVQISQILFEM